MDIIEVWKSILIYSNRESLFNISLVSRQSNYAFKELFKLDLEGCLNITVEDLLDCLKINIDRVIEIYKIEHYPLYDNSCTEYLLIHYTSTLLYDVHVCYSFITFNYEFVRKLFLNDDFDMKVNNDIILRTFIFYKCADDDIAELIFWRYGKINFNIYEKDYEVFFDLIMSKGSFEIINKRSI